jgi:serine/threonine-protein kinase
LVMEYLDGEDLAHLLVRGGPLPVPRAAYIIIQACRGLAAAHARGIVHRDLKPENLFICKRNDGSDLVKVLDFGIAKLHTGPVGTGLTQTGTTMGTPFYMSLEQARGAKEVDHRTDIYALGVILYEILSGTKPHPGESYNEILYHVISKEPAPLDGTRPGLPPGLSAVVHRAMAREVEDRYASAADLTAALIPFAGRAVTPLRSQVGMAAVLGETMNSPVSLPAIAVARVPSQIPVPAPKRGRSRTLVWGALAVVAVLVGTLILWRVLRHEPAPAPAPVPVPTPAPVPPPVPPPTPPPPPTPSPAPETPPPAAKVESPPGRSPGRPPGQRSPKSSAPPAADSKPPQPVAPAAQPAENPENSPNPRRKPVRSIDRSNPFAE